MKDFIGSWILGSEGTKRLAQMATRVHESYESHYRQAAGSFRRFSPAMSASKDIKSNVKLLRLVEDELPLATVIETNADRLQLIAASLGDSEKPFRFVDEKISWLNINVNADNDLWFRATQEAVLKVKSSCRDLDFSFDSLIKTIVPVVAANGIQLRPMGSGMSVHWYIGGIFMGCPISFPDQSTEQAINIAHEMGHQAL
ncbi:MAG: hypothetical protein EOP06_18345, partial [Proteobacteria bacterium]